MTGRQAQDIDAVWSKFYWRVIPLIVALTIINYIDRTNLGFAALQMNEELGFSPQVFGIGASLFFAVYVLLPVPTNLAVHRFGPRLVIGVSAICWGFVAAAMAGIYNETSFYLLRMLLALAEAALIPGATFYISQHFPQASRARAMSWLFIATQLAFVFGGPISGLLLELPSAFGLRPWQLMFIIEAAPAVVLGFVVLWMLPDRPADGRWWTPQERRLLMDHAAEAQRSAAAADMSSIAKSLKDPRLWIMVLIYMCFGASFLSIALWLPQIVRQLHDLSPWQIGFISAGPYLLSAVLMFVVGRESDRRQIRGPFVVWGNVIGSIGVAASAYFSHSPVLALAALTLGMGAFGSVNGPFWSFATSFLRDRAAAVGIGLLSMAGVFGGFLATNLLGSFRQWFGDFEAGLYVLAGILLLAAGLMWIAARGERPPEQAGSAGAEERA